MRFIEQVNNGSFVIPGGVGVLPDGTIVFFPDQVIEYEGRIRNPFSGFHVSIRDTGVFFNISGLILDMNAAQQELASIYFALSRELAGVVPSSSQDYNIYYKCQPIIEGAVNRFMETISRIFKAKGFF